MQKVTGEYQALSSDPESAGDGTRGIGGRLVKLNPSLAALVTWLVCLPVAFAAAAIGQGDPFRLRVAMIPVAVLVAGVIAVGLASRRLPADLASGIAAGLFGGWVAFTLRVAVHGTPFGFGGLGSDAGRLAAMANRYAHAWRSSDGIVPSVPSNYPPLFPWLVGRLSALFHVPAWRLLSPAEAITLSFAVIAGYLLWRRLLPGPLALALSLPVLLCFSLPEKAYEILALAVFIPWAVATFGDPPRGRLHWLPAGLIGGLSIVLYWAFIVFGALGVLALAVLTWRASPDRARYVRHVALTILVAVVVASWYWIPYLGWGLLHGSSQVEYQYQGGGIQDSPLLFLSPTPLGVLELIGVAGLVWWRGRVWWGRPLLLLTGGIYAYWLLGLVSFVVAKHHLLLQDTPRMIGLLLAAAGVLTIAQAAPGVVRRLSVRTVPAGLPALALCLLIIWTGFTAWQAWMPGGPTSPTGLLQPPVNSQRNDTTAAFTTPLPGGSYPRATPRQHAQSTVPHRHHPEGRGIRARGECRTGHPVRLRATVRLRELAWLYRRYLWRGRHRHQLAGQVRRPGEAFPRHRPGRVRRRRLRPHRVRPHRRVHSRAHQPGSLDLAARRLPGARDHLHPRPVQPGRLHRLHRPAGQLRAGRPAATGERLGAEQVCFA